MTPSIQPNQVISPDDDIVSIVKFFNLSQLAICEDVPQRTEPAVLLLFVHDLDKPCLVDDLGNVESTEMLEDVLAHRISVQHLEEQIEAS